MVHLYFRVLSLLTFLLVIGISSSFAQISASQTSGCVPLVDVKFTGVTGATNPEWDFGTGTFAYILNPSHTFTSPGTYLVKFTGIVGGSSVSHTLTITVYGKPSPSFTTVPPTTGCVPFPVAFNSTSTGGVPIIKHEWEFGDGGANTSNNPNPTYTYQIPGTFHVTLIVTDQNGCDSAITMQNLVTTTLKPVASIVTNPNPPSKCNPPFNVSFFGNGSQSNATPNTLTYDWSFGNGNTSNAMDPPFEIYATSGTFTAKLVVTDVNGCKDSTTRNVVVTSPLASFTVPDTVCINTIVNFDRSASLGNNFIWNYGTGQSGTLNYHSYNQEGNYTVKLTAFAGSCMHDTSIQIYVQKVTADFAISPSYACALPQTVNLTNLSSSNASIFDWTFGSPYVHYGMVPPTSNQANPSVVVNYLDTNQYTIDNLDLPMDIMLVASSVHGCRDTVHILHLDTIYKSRARLQPDVAQGCAPLTVVFSDSTRSIEPIVTQIWDLGDGPLINSVTGSVTHTYTTPGIYYAKMFMANSAGCQDTSYSVMIQVGDAPSPNFSISPTLACAKTPVQFNDLSTAGSTPIDTWHYYTDNGTYMSSCFKDPSPSWSFIGSTGSQSVTLVACSMGCCDSITVPNAVDIKGPLAQFKVKMHCDAPFFYEFEGNIQDADYWTWDFGDGTIVNNSTSSYTTHSYAATGDYEAILTAYNSSSGCVPDTFKRLVFVREIKAEFASDSSFCARQSNNLFDASASVDVHSLGNNGYIWIWGDGTPPAIQGNPTAWHIYPIAGFFETKLIVTDINGCRDTAVRKVFSSEVLADFDPVGTYFCVPGPKSFTNLSVSDTTITAWYWDFGNGSTSNDQHPNHNYTQTTPTFFDVVLITENIFGCTDTVMKTIYPSKPNATFAIQGSQNRCAGDSIAFVPTFGSHSGYSWDFGDGNSSSTKTASYPYLQAGSYTVTLTVTDTVGCQNSTTALVNIQDYPIAGFISDADNLKEKCYPFIVQFTDTSISTSIHNQFWNLGTGSPVISNPIVKTTYTLPGTYTVSLTVSTTFGCSSSVTKTIKIDGPLADFKLLPDPAIICKGESVEFTIKDTSDVYTWHWDFGDGYKEVAISPVTHTFNSHPPGGQANVTLVYWSGSGPDSTCVKHVTKTVEIHQVIADFVRNDGVLASDTAHCIGIPDVFTNLSSNWSVLNWNLGDGTTGNANSLAHTYQAAGIYDVSLNIQSSIGCRDTIIKQMHIFPKPQAIATGGDTCLGSPINLSATGGSQYLWSPSTGLNLNTIPNPVAKPTTTTIYAVEVTDLNGCKDTAAVMATIIQPPPYVFWDTSIVIGQSVMLDYFIEPADHYIFSWTPSDSLACNNCNLNSSTPLANTNYILTVADKFGCFEVQSYFNIEVLPLSSIDVPSAFTPNGDNTNDKVYVRGWGIKRLLEFNIYNRWGELVFSTDNIEVGWDGTYKGVLQNTETYAYTVVVETFVDERPLVKKGYVKLLR